MTLVAENIYVGAGGRVYSAPTGSTLPTDATTAPDGAFTDMGHISEDGVSETNDKSTSSIRNWYGDVVREATTEQNYRISVEFMETKAAVLQAYYGDVDATDTAFEIKSDQGVRKAWIIDAVDGIKTRRLVIPDGQVTDTGDITSATEDAVVYPVTITCYPDGSGVKAYGYVDDGS